MRAELDRLWLTALRAMVDVEPYGSSDLGGDPSDDEPPSMTSASPSEDDDPEDPENPSGRKKKKKRKTRRPEGRRSQEAKAIATSKIVVNLPEFTGKDLSEFAENFGRFLRMTKPMLPGESLPSLGYSTHYPEWEGHCHLKTRKKIDTQKVCRIPEGK